MASKGSNDTYMRAVEIKVAFSIASTDLQINRAIFGIDFVLDKRRIS